MAQQARYDVVIIGGGVAAGATATTLRDEGFTGSIAIACAESHPPYTRPGLTKQVLRGEKPASAALVKPAEWFGEQDIDLLTGAAATDIDLKARTVRVAGRTIAYGTLVLATGADPRQLPIAAEHADVTHVLRSFTDADDVREQLTAGTRWLVIGGGFIGAEFACSALIRDCEVHVVLPEDVILEGAFGKVAGAWFDERLRREGATVHNGTVVEALTRADDGSVTATLKDGTTISADQILMGVGVLPNTGLASQAGLELAEEQRGLKVDSRLRTSDPHVYAIGDIAAFDSELHGERVRIEHWDVARAQGAYVAKSLIQIAGGADADSVDPYRELPYFFGTMGNWAFLRYHGVGSGRAIMREGELDTDQLSISWLDDEDRLVAQMTVDRDEDLEAARELILARAVMDPAVVADASQRLTAR